MNRSVHSGVCALKNRVFFLFLAAFCISCCCGCLTAKADNPGVGVEKIKIHGKISVKGNGRFTYLCLSTDSGTDYKLEGDLKDMIWSRYQQEKISLEGSISKKAMGPGFPAVFVIHKVNTSGQ